MIRGTTQRIKAIYYLNTKALFYPESLLAAYLMKSCKMPEYNSDPQIFASCQNLDEVTTVFNHIDTYYRSFIYSPTDSLKSYLKKILKFTLKFILKLLRHVSVLQLHHHQGAHYFMLTEVTVVK